MPINNFKLFDEKKANMMTDEEYAINQQRLNGVQSGVASSQLQNKTLYQTALMCYALAQLMAANGYDANDADAVSTFVNNLSLSMVQKVVDKASATDVANQVAGKWVDAKQLGELKTDVSNNYLSLSGGTMLGNLILHSDPTQSLQAATKQYVDKKAVLYFESTYTGNGKYGSSNPISLTFPFKPSIFLKPMNLDVFYESPSSGWTSKVIFTPDIETNLKVNFWFNEDEDTYMKMNDKTITWYNKSSGYAQLNRKGSVYRYAVIGFADN